MRHSPHGITNGGHAKRQAVCASISVILRMRNPGRCLMVVIVRTANGRTITMNPGNPMLPERRQPRPHTYTPSTPSPVDSGRRKVRWSRSVRHEVVAAMILLSALGLAIADLLERSGRGPEDGLQGVAWLIFIASIFVLRPKGWRFIAYAVLGYGLVAMLSFGMYPVAARIVHPQAYSRECAGWNEYIDQAESLHRSVNSRNSTLFDGGNPTHTMINMAIVSTKVNIAKLRNLNPPPALEDAHARTLELEEGWLTYYESLLTGSESESMLLQMHDDWVIMMHLFDEANENCGAT